jgi:hypothetical protein
MANAYDYPRLTRTGLNSLMMVAFAIPGLKLAQKDPWVGKIGRGAGVGGAVAVFLFDLFEILSPQSPGDVDPPVTPLALQHALDQLKADVIDAMWRGRMDQIADRLPELFGYDPHKP